MTRVIFLGTDKRAISVLEILLKNHEVVGVITQPDKPNPTFIADFADKHKIPVLKPEKLDESAVTWIKDKKPEVLVTAYFAQLIPPELLNLTPSGILVIHPSLLPRWRWGSPVQATLVAGEKNTGVTIMKMDEKFDHGPIVAIRTTSVHDTDTQESLYIRLFEMGAVLLNEVLEKYVSEKLQPIKQDHKAATFAKHLKKGDGFIEGKLLEASLTGQTGEGMLIIPFALDHDKDPLALTPSPETIFNYIRAVTPWPGAYTRVKDKPSLPLRGKGESVKQLKILKCHLEESLPLNPSRLTLDLVQLEGKKPVTWKQFKEGYPEAKF
ncbi:MAG: methionyl-tRNA formyltransferase [bacterium]|nr:methionyl-tRNA formyltransferase [bacterium]